MRAKTGSLLNSPLEHWLSIRKLYCRAWQAPEVVNTWQALGLEYGEMLKQRCFAPEEVWTRHPQLGNCGAPKSASSCTQVNVLEHKEVGAAVNLFVNARLRLRSRESALKHQARKRVEK